MHVGTNSRTTQLHPNAAAAQAMAQAKSGAVLTHHNQDSMCSATVLPVKIEVSPGGHCLQRMQRKTNSQSKQHADR